MIVFNVETMSDDRGWVVLIERVDGLKRSQLYQAFAQKHAPAEDVIGALEFAVRSLGRNLGGPLLDYPEKESR